MLFLYNHVSVFQLPTMSASEREWHFFFLSFFYCVKSPCTNPTVLLLSSGPWKWTGCKTCRVHISQISAENTPTNTVAIFKFIFMTMFCSIGCSAVVRSLCKSKMKKKKKSSLVKEQLYIKVSE